MIVALNAEEHFVLTIVPISAGGFANGLAKRKTTYF
jgi:hypothetical protein